MNKDTFSVINSYTRNYFPVGSSVSCNPANNKNDLDFLVYVKADDYNALLDDLIDIGYKWGGSCQHNSEKDCFDFLKKENINIILTDDVNYFNKFMSANDFCKVYSINNKEDRVFIFDIFRDNDFKDQEKMLKLVNILYLKGLSYEHIYNIDNYKYRSYINNSFNEANFPKQEDEEWI